MLTTAEMTHIVNIGIDLSAEKDRNRLLDKLLTTAIDITGCDAGTLYLYRENALSFRIMKTLSQGVNRGWDGTPIDMPPVQLREENVCAYSAIHKELVNIPDVYNSDRFDFSGPKKYDAITGYHTGSMLVIPMEESRGELIGVLQLLNKQDADGSILPFDEDDELIIQSLGSMTAVSLANMLYIDEIEEQMHSFVQAFATAVDERTPYNGSHTRKVTIYAGILALEVNRKHAAGLCDEHFDDDRREQLIMSAALHDIGKMIVPLSVMNKATRLDAQLPFVEQRFALLSALYERDHLAGLLTDADYAAVSQKITDSISLIREKDSAGFLPDEVLAQIEEIGAQCYTGPDGQTIPWLTPEELTCLLVRKGTLTSEDRRVMESHAAMTGKILEKVRFNHKYEQVPFFAASHHEFLNGKGYPNHLCEEELPLEVRILTVVDVFDALTSADRPYKKPMPRERAYAILHDMAKDGQIEDRLVFWLEDALKNVTQEEIDALAASATWDVMSKEF